MRTIIALVLLCSVSAGCEHTALSTPRSRDASPALAPPGAHHTDGTVQVLWFFSPRNTAVTTFAPTLQRIHERFAGDHRVEVIGLCRDRDPGWSPAGFMRENRLTFPVERGGDVFAEKYGIDVVPAVVLIGADGRVMLRQWSFGERYVGAYEALIRAELAGGD